MTVNAADPDFNVFKLDWKSFRYKRYFTRAPTIKAVWGTVGENADIFDN